MSSDAATPPAMRAKVFARDGQACANCKSRRGLPAHHVHWRSKGGPTAPGNLVTLCARCHFSDADASSDGARVSWVSRAARRGPFEPRTGRLSLSYGDSCILCGLRKLEEQDQRST
ncbi:MAG: HNH endonuclease [Planctomycetes bacterium]|nr:HNH endonuclease [Planctomycetota bacterium]